MCNPYLGVDWAMASLKPDQKLQINEQIEKYPLAQIAYLNL